VVDRRRRSSRVRSGGEQPGVDLSGLELRYLVENVAADAFWHFDRYSALGEMREEWRQRYPPW
jgi:hypothetical protein